MDIFDQQFISALETGNRDLVRQVLKSDLHCHAGLGFRSGVLEKRVGRTINPAPLRMSSLHEMNRWIADELTDLYSEREAAEFALRSALAEAANDGITLLEMSIDISFIFHYGNDPFRFARMVSECRGEVDSVMNFRPELGVARDMDPKVALPLATACLDTGIFSCIDLYGTEDAQPPETYKELYSKAKKAGIKCKIHLGEFGNAIHLLQSAQLLEPDAIQHGISAAEDMAAMKWLADHKITLNICPTSNIRLSRVSDYKYHPIRRLFDAGIPVTINSDDIMVFGQNVSDEYINLFNAGTLSALELNAIRITGLSQ